MIKNVYKLLLLMLLVLPVSVKALTGSIDISCTPTEAKPGDEVTCTVSGTSSPTGITEFEFDLALGSGLTYKDQRESGDPDPIYFVYKNRWNGDMADIPNGHVPSYRLNPTDTSFAIGEFTVVVGASATGEIPITISNVKYSYDTGDVPDEATVTGKTATITVSTGGGNQPDDPSDPDDPPVPANVSKLKSLSITNGTLHKTFDSDFTSYIVTLDSASTSKFSVTAVAEDSTDTIIATSEDGGTLGLSDITFAPKADSREMVITITVGTGDSALNYILYVRRPLPADVGEPVLSSLIVGGKRIDLSTGDEAFTVTLSDTLIDSYQVVAKLADEDNFKFSDWTLDFLDVDLSGEKEIKIEIYPKDSNSGYGSKTYVITVNKEKTATPSSSPKSSSGKNVGDNPGTGRSSVFVVGILLGISFLASIYFYKKNMSEFN